MTPQEKLIAVGLVGAAVSKFYFHRPLLFSAVVGLSVLSAWSIISAKADTTAS